MALFPDQLKRTACELIHHSSKSKSELTLSLRNLLKQHFYENEEVLISSRTGTKLGTIIKVLRSSSPSNKENQVKYSVKVDAEVLEQIPFTKLRRKETVADSEIRSFVEEIASRSSDSSPWRVHENILKEYNMKLDANDSPKLSSVKRPSSAKSTPEKPSILSQSNGVTKKSKARTPMSTPKKRGGDATSSNDNSPVIKKARKSGVAPNSTIAKKEEKLKLKKVAKDGSKKISAVKSPKIEKVKTEKTNAKAKPKQDKKQMSLSGFLTSPGHNSTNSDVIPLTYEERMEKRALNTSKKVIKYLVNMDLEQMERVVTAAGNSLQTDFFKFINNRFVYFLISDAHTKNKTKGMTTKDRAEYRREHCTEKFPREFIVMQRCLKAAKLEDTWISGSELPDFPLAVDLPKQSTFVKCLRVSVFLICYHHLLCLRKVPNAFDLMSAIEEGSFEKVIRPVIISLVSCAWKWQRLIPHFVINGYLPFVKVNVTEANVIHIVRRILSPDYRIPIVDDAESFTSEKSGNFEGSIDPSAEGQSEDVELNTFDAIVGDKKLMNMEVKIEDKSVDDGDSITDSGSDDVASGINEEQSQEDKILIEKFTVADFTELEVEEQARVLEILIEIIELSGPIRGAMKNIEDETKKTKNKILELRERMDEINKELEVLPPMIPEEDYMQYTRVQTIVAVKSNRKRNEFEGELKKVTEQLAMLGEYVELTKTCSRFRGSPLGVDRYHRRYWIFPFTKGILIEQGAFTTEEKDGEPLALPVIPRFNRYEITTDGLMDHLRILLLGGYPSNTAPIRWFHVNSVALMDSLMNNLNTKGVREAALKANLEQSRAAIFASLTC